MFREKLLKKIEEIQEENKSVSKYKSLAEVAEPGKTGFTCRKGYVLACALTLVPRKKKVITMDNKQMSLEDFMGVHPYLCIIMESSSETYKAGDIAIVDIKSIEHTAQDLVIKSALATIIPESSLLGTDKNMQP